jgi:hypothetical protein
MRSRPRVRPREGGRTPRRGEAAGAAAEGCHPRPAGAETGGSGDVRTNACDAATQKGVCPSFDVARKVARAFASGAVSRARRSTHLDGREQVVHGRRAVGATTRGASRRLRAPAVSKPNLCCCPFERHRGFPTFGQFGFRVSAVDSAPENAAWRFSRARTPPGLIRTRDASARGFRPRGSLARYARRP